MQTIRPQPDRLLLAILGTAIGLSVLVLAITLFWGSGPVIAEIPWYIPMVAAFISLAGFCIAFLALGRYQVLRDPVSFWVGLGFATLSIGHLFYVLAWPGLLPDGRSIIARLDNTPALITQINLTLFGGILLAAVLLRSPEKHRLVGQRGLGAVAGWLVFVTLAYILLVAFEQYLPVAVNPDGTFTTFSRSLIAFHLLLFGAGSILSTRYYLGSRDVLAGYVAFAQMALVFIILMAIIGGKRYDLWWYLQRAIAVCGYLIVLFGLLSEYIHLVRLEREKTYDLHDRNERLAFLSDAAAELLRGNDPNILLDRLFQRLSVLLGLEIYIYYRLSTDGPFLELAALGGIRENQFETLRRQELGQAICGTVALTQQGRVVEDIQHIADPQIIHLQALGITAYACYPLKSQERLHGTLSFGTRGISHFNPGALELIRVVCDIVATGIERKEAEGNLLEYAVKLERSNRDLQEFTYATTHGLQEPLRKIELFADKLIEDLPELEQPPRERLARMRLSAGQMRSMVEGLSQLSRLAVQSQRLEQVALDDVVAQVVSDLGRQIQSANGVIEVSGLPTVEADRAQLCQLFEHLIGNALKFQPPGGKPHIHITSQPLLPDRVVIVVQDNGIGFEEEWAERIFEPFQRLVRKNEFDGSGIGLTICRKIVERHQGTISVTSKRQKGSSFMINLPIKQNR